MAKPVIVRKVLTLSALGAMLTLSACESVPLFSEPIILNCPDYFIVEDAASRTAFRPGPGRDIVDIEDKAKIGTVDLACISDVKKETNSGILELIVRPVFGVERGAADTDLKTTLPYFISITDPDKNILFRHGASFDVSFLGNKTRLVAVAPITRIEVPITPQRRERYYRIYVGIELTHDQLAYNRKLIADGLR